MGEGKKGGQTGQLRDETRGGGGGGDAKYWQPSRRGGKKGNKVQCRGLGLFFGAKGQAADTDLQPRSGCICLFLDPKIGIMEQRFLQLTTTQLQLRTMRPRVHPY